MSFSARVVSSLAMTATLSLLASPAHAVFDHLQCYKIKDDATKAEYSADLAHTDLTFPNATGCEIKVPAKLLCVDTEKTNVSPTPPGAGDGTSAQKYLCYKAKCPKAQPTATLSDQFGSHGVEVKSTSLLCAPIPAPATCTDGIQNGTETDLDCGGSCPPCADGDNCLLASDCTSGICTGNVCQAAAPSCTDNTQNGMETGLDCGGFCPACPDGQGCNSGSDCISNSCVGSVCVSLLSNGSSCMLNGQCTSNNCVDGKCCNSACNGTCEACSAAKKGSGMDGACGPISAATDPDNECSASAVATCGTNGTCSGSSSCALYPGGTVCNPGSCSTGVATNPDMCDGMGFCTDAGFTSCTPYACGPSSCRTNCATDGDCDTAVAYCSAGACVPKLNDGGLCSFNAQCVNGNCVDGVCCNTSCNALCQACTAAKKGGGSDGTCGNIGIGTDPDNECSGAQNCDGSGACQP